MMINVLVHDVDENISLCFLHEVMITVKLIKHVKCAVARLPGSRGVLKLGRLLCGFQIFNYTTKENLDPGTQHHHYAL